MIPHLIEAGIDVLNPVQPECMNFEEIPMDVHPYGFWITIGISAVLSVIGAIFLIIFTQNKRRD